MSVFGISAKTAMTYIQAAHPERRPTLPRRPACSPSRCKTVGMIVRLARDQDIPGFIELAGQVEHWFGPMVDDPGFRAAVSKHIGRARALVAVTGDQAGLLGGLLVGAHPPACHLRWLVVTEQARGQGVGSALVNDAIRRFVQGPGIVEVVTFGADHPGATASGARVFYERLGFTPAEAAPAGPEGGSRQVYRKAVA
jgi:GNAT superfamily N-acetyltransferase